jgi:methylmalonyl-CoA/ethylmalonyl-CoA epimerase
VQLDHVAIAVRSIEAAADRLCQLLGYRRETEKITNTRQKVNVLFLRKTGCISIKLIEPSDQESPLWSSLRKGEGMHHLCFKVDDVGDACADLTSKGARVIAPPQPGEAFNDHAIAFCYVGLGLNIELIDTDERAGVISDPVG